MQRLVENLVSDPYMLSNGESKHNRRYSYSMFIEFISWCRLPKELIVKVVSWRAHKLPCGKINLPRHPVTWFSDTKLD